MLDAAGNRDEQEDTATEVARLLCAQKSQIELSEILLTQIGGVSHLLCETNAKQMHNK
jgi:hypothetical protein